MNELATALLRQRSSDAKRSRSSELHPGGPHQEIRVEINSSTSDDDTEKLQERLAKLSGGVVIIRVGAATEVELKEKKHRVEDALSATRAAAVLETVRRMQAEAKNKNIGYDVLRNDYLDMVAVGIIDPAKVTKGALQNAASIAAMVFATEALITDTPAEEPAPAMPPSGGMY